MTSTPPPRLTMEDVAQLAGVSKITVSRALRGHPSVRPDTRDRIVEVAKRAGYRLNLPARNLRLSRSRTVCVVVEAASTDTGVGGDAFPLDFLRSISQELTGAGYSLLLATSDDLEASALQAAEGGILLGQGADDSALHRIGDLPIPWVVWGVERPGAAHPTVDTDNVQGGRLAAERFAVLGKKKLVFLGDVHHAQIADRARGFTETAETAGMNVRVAGSDFTFAAGHRATRALLDNGATFDAIFASSDLIAMGALLALSESGKRVPDEVSVIGYDDTHAAAAFVPPLTSIHQNWREGGRQLARKVIDLIEHRDAHSEMLPASLTLRAT